MEFEASMFRGLAVVQWWELQAGSRKVLVSIKYHAFWNTEFPSFKFMLYLSFDILVKQFIDSWFGLWSHQSA